MGSYRSISPLLKLTTTISQAAVKTDLGLGTEAGLSLVMMIRASNEDFSIMEKVPTIGPSPGVRHYAKQVLTNLNSFSPYDV